MGSWSLATGGVVFLDSQVIGLGATEGGEAFSS